MKLSYIVKTIQYLTTALFVGLLFIALFERELIKEFVVHFSTLIETLGWSGLPIVAGLILIEALPFLGLFFPGQQLFVLAIGFSQGVIFPATLITGAVFMTIGNIISYFIGQKYGSDLLDKFGPSFGIGKTEVRYLERGFDKYGAWFLFFGKFHNLTASLGALLAGSTKMSFSKFFIANTGGTLLWITTMWLIGRLFAQYYETIIDNIGKILLGIMLVFWLYIYFFHKEKWSKYLREKEQELSEASPNEDTDHSKS